MVWLRNDEGNKERTQNDVFSCVKVIDPSCQSINICGRTEIGSLVQEFQSLLREANSAKYDLSTVDAEKL